jgi:TrmH family RNA methyltransferase
MQEITSRDNPKIKRILQLKSKKGRQKNQAYIIDGLRIVEHAIDNQIQLEAIIMTQNFMHEHLEYVRHLSHGHIYVVTDKIFAEIVETQTPQGICAIVPMVEIPMKKGKVLFLDEIQDPGNMGTLIRTADAAGFSGVVLSSGCTDPYSQKSIRSSMGSIMSMSILQNKTIDSLASYKGSIYGAALEGGLSYKSFEYKEACVLVIGNEGKGISNDVLEYCDFKIYIPMIGAVESLNASIAGGILMFAMV